MGAMRSLATEADYASVLRTANHFRAEADQLRELNAEMLEALKECKSVLAMMTEPNCIQSSTTQQAWSAAVAAEARARAAIIKCEAR